MPSSIRIVLLSFAIVCSNTAMADQFYSAHENVLGTTLELRVEAASQQAADVAQKNVLNEIQRLSAVFSTYDSKSEIAQFLALPIGSSMPVSGELSAAFQACEQWQHISRGAFNPAAEELLQADPALASKNLTQIVSRINGIHWKRNSDAETVIRTSDTKVSLNAIAKGLIIDYATNVAMNTDGVSGVTVNIGGDLRVAGDSHQAVAIADPRHDTLTGAPIHTLSLGSAAIATSGFTERPGHIVDPRSGKLANGAVSASVMAPTAATADALATIACVLSVKETLAIVNSLSGIECLLVASNGVVLTSEGWPQDDAQGKDSKKAESTGHDFLVEFEIGRPENSRRYRRPYVAVWVEDKDRFPVKTLSLFVMQENPGPRWYRDIRRWYSDDQMRQLVDQKDLIKTISKPTRNPGQYKVQWDGRDDSGKLLKAGKYTLLIESAREHGSYQLIRQEFEIGKSLTKKLKGNAEIPAASFVYKVDKS